MNLRLKAAMCFCVFTGTNVPGEDSFFKILLLQAWGICIETVGKRDEAGWGACGVPCFSELLRGFTKIQGKASPRDMKEAQRQSPLQLCVETGFDGLSRAPSDSRPIHLRQELHELQCCIEHRPGHSVLKKHIHRPLTKVKLT